MFYRYITRATKLELSVHVLLQSVVYVPCKFKQSRNFQIYRHELQGEHSVE